MLWGSSVILKVGAVMGEDSDAITLTPKQIVEHFQLAYRQAYGHEAQVSHMFAEWYQVNGEAVHRSTLFSEIGRLRTINQHRAPSRPDRTVLQRLISRLRGI